MYPPWLRPEGIAWFAASKAYLFPQLFELFVPPLDPLPFLLVPEEPVLSVPLLKLSLRFLSILLHIIYGSGIIPTALFGDKLLSKELNSPYLSRF
jgi:hypothetical protein